MKRLFVDCDDTLVKWLGVDGQPLEGQNPYGGGAEKWEANAELVVAIETWLEREKDADPRVIVWSGGGGNYARRWAEMILPGRWHLASEKNISYPADGDVCVDDALIKVAGVLLTPDEFIAEMQVGEGEVAQ